MVRNVFGRFVLVCDNCGKEGEKEYEDFDSAVKGKKEEGWKSKKYSNGWVDLCDGCKD